MSQPEAPPDEELLSRWRAGDQAAGTSLLLRHHESVARFFMSKVGAEGEDLVQATFLGLLDGGLQRFRDDASFRTFLFAIARKKLLEHLRNTIRDRARFDPQHATIAGLHRTVSSVLDAHGQNKLLLAALRQLPIDTQLMLELHYWEDMRINDIALVMELPANTVKTRMHRGRARLNEHMRALADSREQLETTLRGLDGWAKQLRRELDE
ncbi:RNA polymerase sigma-70 factor [Enhygromyxa salina]|uniref:RNA polymerase sigma-70 factor n=1 Tax=Enhygromyxa salina TaxID=215803 RepID=A0A0C1ZP86_9BACT|nr:sigma-70 family RNA polymerase sigma factor [Enhygromyxa salina]KIG19399.1 RNA polymerase sigma-70 factor [Enhygromyxa salina]